MTTFVITAPDGKKYKVTGDTPEGAYAALMKMLDGQGVAPATTSTEAAQYAPNGIPMNAAAKAEIMAKAKAGTLALSPESLAGSEAMTAKSEAAMRPKMTFGATVADYAKSILSGLSHVPAEVVGMPGTLQDLVNKGTDWAGTKLGLDMSNPAPGFLPFPSGADIRGVMSDLTGGATEYQPKTTPGEYLQTGAEFLFPGVGLKNSLLAGFASEGAGQATEGTALEPWARVAAGLLAPAALSAAGNVAKRVISPMGGVDPERLALVDILAKAGVPVTAGQKSGSDWLKRVEAGTSAGAKMADTQAEALTSAALKTAGVNAPRATTDVMEGAFKGLGQVFDDAVAGLDITPTPAAITKTSEAIDKFKRIGAAADAPGMFKEIHKAFMRVQRGGAPLPASEVSKWRSELSAMTTSSNTAIREVAKDVLRVVDGAIDDAMTAAGRDPAKLATARAEYRNLLAITEAMKGKSEATAVGLLTPEMLPAAVKRQSGKAYVTGGRGEIGDLARAAQGVLRRPSSSGTAENIAAMMRPAALPIGASAGAMAAGPLGALAGAGLALAPGFARRASMWPLVQRYLGNQAAGASTPIFSKANTVGLAGRIPGLLAQ